MRVVLASKSPRRKEILENLGVAFTIVSADADESSDIADPAALVKELALRKGQAVRALLTARGDMTPDTLIIASDTVVAVDGEILGKPKDEADATRMLALLSGRAHQVISGVALLKDNAEAVDFDSTAVKFTPMTGAEIAQYVKSGEPMDKAGAYAVQGRAALYIQGLDGDYFNVVGLPVFRLEQLCRRFLDCSLLDLNSK